MSATQQESEEYYKETEGRSRAYASTSNGKLNAPSFPIEGSAPNFISEIFFLCCAYLHIGVMHTIKEHKGISQQIRHEERQVAEIEADSTWRGVSSVPIGAEPCARAAEAFLVTPSF